MQQRQVANPDQRHLERARDRRGRQREHVDVGLDLLDLLFVLYAEALLLVDDQQPEILELDVVGEQAVGADHTVDVAVAHPVHHLLGLAGGEESGEHLDTNRVPGESIGERVAVLARQQCGRCQYGDLLALLDRLEGSPNGDLGLAESDVAADQPVHRERALHVDFDVVDRRALVRCLDEREGVFHLALPGRVEAERVADGVDPGLVQHDQFLGDLTNRRADLALRLGEIAAAETVQGRRLAADVLPQGVDLVGRHVQLVAALVGDQQIVALDPADRALDHAFVVPDTVLVVHDVVAGLEVLEGGGSLATRWTRLAVCSPAPGEIAFCDHGDLGVRHGAAAMDRCDDDRPAGSGRGTVAGDGEVEPLVEQDLVQPIGRPGAVGCDRDREALADQLGQARCQT